MRRVLSLAALLLLSLCRIASASVTVTAQDYFIGECTSTTVNNNAGSWTPAASTTYLIALAQNGAGTAPAIPSLAGNGFTFTQVATQVSDNGISRITLWTAIASSPSAGTTSMTFNDTTSLCLAWIDKVSGNDTAAPIVQAVTGDNGFSTTASATLAAFSSANNGTFATACFCGDFSGSAMTAGSGYSFSQQFSWTAGMDVADEWRSDNNTTPSVTVAGSGSHAIMIAVELKAAASTSPIRHRSHQN